MSPCKILAEIALAPGVSACSHNHVGSPVETRAELDCLFALVDRSLVSQRSDLGHLAWAGDDPAACCRDYDESIRSIHVKDIDPRVLAERRSAGCDHSDFPDQGIVAEFGEAMVDFPAVFAALPAHQGWSIVGTDVTTKPSALASAKNSRVCLRPIGA